MLAAMEILYSIVYTTSATCSSHTETAAQTERQAGRGRCAGRSQSYGSYCKKSKRACPAMHPDERPVARKSPSLVSVSVPTGSTLVRRVPRSHNSAIPRAAQLVHVDSARLEGARADAPCVSRFRGKNRIPTHEPTASHGAGRQPDIRFCPQGPAGLRSIRARG